MTTNDATPQLLPIAQFVREYAHMIVEYCETVDDGEGRRLLDPSYATSTFGLPGKYSFLKRSDEIVPGSNDDKHYGKGYDSVYMLYGEEVRLNSQWKSAMYPRFIAYIRDLELVPPREAAALLAGTTGPGPSPKASKTKIPSKYHIGNAQNSWVRNVLSRIRPDTQSYGGAAAALEFFQGSCAYCGTRLTSPYDEDHVYSISFNGLGEHKRGNLVPACKPCNSKKSDHPFRIFIRDALAPDLDLAAERINRIEQHMARCNYMPLGEDPRAEARDIRRSIAHWRKMVASLADDCVGEIQHQLGVPRDQ